MADTSPYIGLKKPLENEFVDIGIINGNMDKIDQSLGQMSNLPTVAKDAAGAISEIHDQLRHKPRVPIVLNDGVQIVQGGDARAILHPTMTGRTLINRLGRDGNCESIAGIWATTNCTLALDTANKAVGNTSVKYTATVNGAMSANFPSSTGRYSVDVTKYYLVVASFKNVSVAQGPYLVAQAVGGTLNKSSNKITNTTQFEDSYATIAPSELTGMTQLNLYAYANTATLAGQTAYFDAVRIYEITAAEKSYIDGLTVANAQMHIANKYPYVDDMKHVNAVYVQSQGKNLLPPFSEWTIHANANIADEYTLVLNATVSQMVSEYRTILIPNQFYTYSCIATGRYYIAHYDKNDTLINSNIATGSFVSFTVPSNAAWSRVRVDSTAAGTFTYTNPMLNIGSTALPFEPQKPSYIYLPDCNLRSNLDGSVADKLYMDGQGKTRVTRRFREVVLDGSLTWAIGGDGVGNKSVYSILDPSDTLWAYTAPVRQYSVVKYDGKTLRNNNTGTMTLSDDVNVSSNWVSSTGLEVIMTIADSDSGWGESYTPSTEDIKAYFNGWRMLERNAAGAANVEKTFVPIGVTLPPKTTTSTTNSGTNTIVVADASGLSVGNVVVVNGFNVVITAISGTTLTLSTTVNVSANDYVWKVSGFTYVKIDGTTNLQSVVSYTPYRLMYQLAQSIDEAVNYEGSLMLHEGANQLEVGTGIVVREAANPKQASGVYYINNTVTSNPLKNNVNMILRIYKNSSEDKSWKNQTTFGYGKESAYTAPSNFDQIAGYSATYLALDTYTLGIAPQTINVEYEPNIRESVESLVREVVEARTEVSVLRNTTAHKQKPDWITPTLLGGWVEYSSNYASASYYKDEGSIVRIRGLLKGGAMASNTILFYLPVGYRPKLQVSIVGVYGPTFIPIQIVIKADGAVIFGGALSSNSFLNIDGTFLAEQ